MKRRFIARPMISLVRNERRYGVWDKVGKHFVDEPQSSEMVAAAIAAELNAIEARMWSGIT